MKSKHLFLILLCCLSGACKIFDDAQYAKIVELIAPEQEEPVSVDGGEVNVHVYSSGKVSVTVMNDIGDWAEVGVRSFEGDGDIPILFEANSGFRRMVKLLLTLNGGEKEYVVIVRQDGVEPYLECDSPYAVVDGSDEDIAGFDLSTNIPVEELLTEVEYQSGSSGWIREISPDVGRMSVETAPNPGDHVSRARIRFSYVDGWEQYFKVDIFITSSDRDGEFGTRIDFEQMLGYAGQGTVTDEVYVEGVVISDWHSKNMAFNPSINYDQVDVTQSRRTAYLQSPDGSKGVRLLYDNPDDNTLVKGTLLSMSLLGATVTREDDPLRYTVSGLKPTNMVKSETGTIVEKRKSISALSDSDLYTYVTLTNTEFVYKTGSYANVYENYTLKSSINSMCSGNNNRFDVWASLLVDDQGKAIYAPVNMLCLWRRSGNGVPQGVGDTQGIIVHEVNHRYGDQGRYQIRVIDESGFCQEWNGASAYHDFAEWDGSPYHYRYGLYKTINARYADPNDSDRDRLETIFPSDDISAAQPTPAAELSSENKTLGSSAGAYPFGNYSAFCAKRVTNSGPGDRGIASGDTSDEYPRSLCLNNQIKGWFKWDGNNIVGYNGVVIKTTRAATGSLMTFSYSFDVGKISAATSQYFPAHWCVEYSIDGGSTYKICPDAVTGKDYVHLRSLPWWDVNIGGIKYYTCNSCGLGATEHLSVVPSDVFGKGTVYFRIRPYDNVMAIFPIEWYGDTETSEVRYNTTANTVINFENIVIRVK
ncbi:MAG: BACON domain-containing protein [Bacteroidales bacterium]|nr:BACON domain-containing protein [Bacteroidales bacterium]